ncbi:AMIN domain-containing protein [Acaryochloris marina]|uniref:AMIN domain-containing protein n=1 Tax=Acaryochloris marina TaxID=155978 RepID=UPI001BAEFCFB|nr:AMIN domain-containing protein [Acaryochloris marina]QUY41314.1 AMIN domain-containing protein [Acaryochloris marina S15]
MNSYQGKPGIIIGCAAAALGAMIQPVWAAETEVTNVQLNPTAKGFELVLGTQGDNRPPIFTVNRGNTSVSDVSNSLLRLPEAGSFQQKDPAPGIKFVEVRQLDPDTVRITVEGVHSAPIAETIRNDNRDGVLAIKFDGAPGSSDPVATSSQPSNLRSRASAVPSFRSRAKAPPVGDMAIAPLNVEPDRIDLGSDQIIPKLLLREAPVREVLTLLGRAANVNVAFAEQGGEGEEGSSASSTITLDIENESVDDVFNYVLRLSGMQANRVGQTVFVGKTLPGDAQNRVVRTIRLNQIKATSTSKRSNTLSSKADTGGNITPQSDSGSSSSTTETGITRETSLTQEIESQGAKETLENYGANGGSEEGSSALLEGLEVVADGRTNTITLIGTPRKVETATSILTRLDVRQRQVAINVKFIDVNLLKGKTSNADLQFRANDSLGIGFRQDPNGSGNSGLSTIFGSGAVDIVGSGLFTLTETFLANLFVSIQNNNAKILTNPTLLVQEGSSAQVNLTQQVFTGFVQRTNTDATDAGGVSSTQSLEPNIQNAGVILNVAVDHIDDNGFVTMSMSPEVSSISGTFTDALSGGQANLLAQRRIETGKLRLRDGQTLVLTGIIQDQDRVGVSKVPILGDIPLLGRLFRRETNSRERTELVVLVRPEIVDDSDQSTFGYDYKPGEESRKLLKP